jgi:deazaflavin-dependent oxidoreductase (nitroreductase family)
VVGVRDLSKPIASLLSWRLHPWLIRAGGRLHLALLRRFPGARIVGSETLILTTRGRSSGRPRSTPVYFVRRGDRLYIAASFAGRDTPPNWYLNLVADPHVNVSAQGTCGSYLARELAAEEASRVWPLLVASYRPFTRYQQRTQRRIPVIELSPVLERSPA